MIEYVLGRVMSVSIHRLILATKHTICVLCLPSVGVSITLGYASEKTELRNASLTPDGKLVWGKKSTDVRKNGDLWWLRPDGKTSPSF